MLKEELVQRLELLETEKDQLLANLNMYIGAIQECRYWIEQIEKSENTVSISTTFAPPE